MQWIISLLIGGIIGWLASLIMKTDEKMGCLANVLVGIGGSALGYFVPGLFGIAPSGGLLRFAVAVGGAVLLIAILRSLGVFKK